VISIQRATLADAEIITDIGVTTFLESHGHSAPATDIDAYVSSKYNLRAVQEELTNPENIFHIIYYKTQPVGFSKILLNNPNPLIEQRNVTKLERIYILKAFHDLKLGFTLLQHIITISKEANQSGIWLHVWIENARTVAFYKKYGFKIIGHYDFKISETHSNPNYVMQLKYE
jgi:ribosomal protein S18 acetylase RimI-like enzyme